MWPFKNKSLENQTKKPELSCIGKSIIEDLNRLNEYTWKIEFVNYVIDEWDYLSVYKFTNPNIKYSLLMTVMEENICHKGNILVRISDIDESVLNVYDMDQIWDKLLSIYKHQKNKENDYKRNEDNKKLKEWFPNCFKDDNTNVINQKCPKFPDGELILEKDECKVK